MDLNNEAMGLASAAACLASEVRDLSQLSDRGLLISTPEALQGLGFEQIHLLGEGEEIYDLGKKAALLALQRAALEPGEIDALIWSGAVPCSHFCPGGNAFLEIFNYPACRLQWELGMEEARVSAVAQQGCCSLFQTLHQAVLLLRAHPDWDHVLCVAADALPGGVCREILYTVISDAASAVVVSRKKIRYLWRHYHQISKGYYWNVPEKQKEIIAAYFPVSRLVLKELMDLEGGVESLEKVITTGVNPVSWKLLAAWSGIPEEKLYFGRTRFGHTICSDTLVKLLELEEEGSLKSGSRLLCFTYGFGSSWAGFTLEARFP